MIPAQGANSGDIGHSRHHRNNRRTMKSLWRPVYFRWSPWIPSSSARTCKTQAHPLCCWNESSSTPNWRGPCLWTVSHLCHRVLWIMLPEKTVSCMLVSLNFTVVGTPVLYRRKAFLTLSIWNIISISITPEWGTLFHVPPLLSAVILQC